jgi:hypothetical protein
VVKNAAIRKPVANTRDSESTRTGVSSSPRNAYDVPLPSGMNHSTTKPASGNSNIRA